MGLTLDSLKDYLRDQKGLDGLDGDSALFSNGTLDSASQLELIMFIEDQARIQVHPADLVLDNFDSMDRILNYVKSRSGG